MKGEAPPTKETKGEAPPTIETKGEAPPTIENSLFFFKSAKAKSSEIKDNFAKVHWENTFTQSGRSLYALLKLNSQIPRMTIESCTAGHILCTNAFLFAR